MLAVPVLFGDTGTVFNVDTDVRTVRLGDKVDVRLKVIGDAVDSVVGGTDGAKLHSRDGEGFHARYTFVPQQEGECSFGPYTLSFNGQTLTSQTVKIHVLPKWTGEDGSYFRIDRPRIVLGESIELVQETWRRKRRNDSTSRLRIMRATNDYDCSLGRSFHSMTISHVNVTTTNCYDRQTWFLKPRKPGVFRITRQIFESWPEDIIPPDFSVTVDAIDQPAPGN